MKQLLVSLLLLTFFSPTFAQTVADTSLCGKAIYYPDDFDKDKKRWIFMPVGGAFWAKTVNKADTFYMAVVQVRCYKYFPPSKGVKVLFEDGTIFDFPDSSVKAEFDKSDREIVAKSYFQVKASDLPYFAANRIKKVRLDIHDKEIKQGETLRLMLNCLLEKK